jgi:hypothetical protein
MSRRVLKAIVVALAAAVVGCSDSSNSPGAPTTATLSLAGTWKTGITVVGQSATMSWVLTQSGTSVTGPVTVSLPTGIVLLNGALTGTVSQATATSAVMTYTIGIAAGGIPTEPTCTGQFGGTMNAAAGSLTTMTGDMTVRSATCTPPFASTTTLTMTKQ